MTNGVIPQSNALSEASPDSLDDYMSKDPEVITEAEKNATIERLRAMRVKWEASDKEKPARAQGKAIADKAKSLVSGASAADLDL